MHNMKRRRAGHFGALAVCMGLIAPVAAQAAPCATHTDRTALEVRLLQTDNIVHDGALGLKDLGIDQPVSAELILPTYLYRYRRTGQFEASKPA